MVGNQLMAIGHIINVLALPTKASVLEMGAGWGNTSLFMAQSGYDVTVVDINDRYGKLNRRRAQVNGVEIGFHRMSFDDVESLGQRFDCVLFFESFHHSNDHLKLLDLIPNVLTPNGILALSGEPMNERLPYDWGLNPAGEALWQIRTHGWYELVFRESYLISTLKQKGFRVEKHELPNNPTGTTMVCRFTGKRS